MLNVFLTIDTELWPRHPNWRATSLQHDYDVDIVGATPTGDFGVPYQLAVLNKHGLKGVFFVEALFACVVGLERLRQLVSLIQDAGHEVQLHVHTEWLAWMKPSLLPGRTGQNCRDFTEDEQVLLLTRAVDNLRTCGVVNPCAFRAGNYGANFDTLRALARNGLRFDTSYNFYYLDAECGLRTDQPLLQPCVLHGVYEFPITCFQDRPGHVRHAELCACSSQELIQTLLAAWRLGWYAYVLVSHSFEMIRGRKHKPPVITADRIVIRRFERLCRFLAANRDKFRTTGFANLVEQGIPPATAVQPLRSPLHRTAWRVMEQAARRVF